MSDWLTKLSGERALMRALYQKAAAVLLAPERVLIRWQESYNASSNGGISRAPDGTYVIDIDPSLTLDVAYKTFLHECSHALDSSYTIARSHYYRLPSGAKIVSFDESQARRAEPSVKMREDRAELISSKIAAYANAHAYDHIRFDEPVLFARLRALSEPRARMEIKELLERR